MKLFFEILTFMAFVVAIVVSPIAWVRIIRAKNRKAYWGSMLLFAAPIVTTFLFASAAGLLPEAPAQPATIPTVLSVLERLPHRQLVLLIIVAVVWVGGGNLLFYFHNRRLGKTWRQALNPLDPPFRDFNAREWVTLAVLFAVSMAVMSSL
jgi:hypothetical protein